jgi:hypothetical protein
MELLDFVEQYIDDQDSGIKALLAFFLNLVMEYEAEKQAGAGRYQRSPGRKAYRNGKPNFSLGCDGSRRFSGIADDEMVMGFPAEMLPEIVDAVKIITQAPGSKKP